MSELEEERILDEQTLYKLNRAIDKVILQKRLEKFDYDLIEKALEEMQMYKKLVNKKKPIIVTLKKEEMLSIALNFFKYIDEEFFRRAVDVILNQTDTLKLNIYNLHSVQDFDKQDDREMEEYSKYPKFSFRAGNGRVYIPTQYELDKNESKALNDDTCTLNDLYNLIHEIGHLSFSRLKQTGILDVVKKEQFSEEKRMQMEKFDLTWELLTETVPSSFEGMFTTYLVSNKLFSEEAVKQLYSMKLDKCFFTAEFVYASLVFAREKEKNGKITEEYLEKAVEQRQISVAGIRRLARDIIEDSEHFIYINRYALAGLIAPTIVQKYNKNNSEGIKAFKEFLQHANNGEFLAAMKVYGIEMNEDGIDKLVDNMMDLDDSLLPEEEVR